MDGVCGVEHTQIRIIADIHTPFLFCSWSMAYKVDLVYIIYHDYLTAFVIAIKVTPQIKKRKEKHGVNF